MATNNQTPAAKDGLQDEEQLEEMLNHLDQVQVQASLPRQHIRPACCFPDSSHAAAASPLGASAHVGAFDGQTPVS
jgi:hypothetical protein